MLITCWSAKGGAGTSVTTAALSLVLSRRHPAGCLLTDLVGDLPAVLGCAETDGPGVRQWMSAWPDVPDEGLCRLERSVVDGLDLLPSGPVVDDVGQGPAALVEQLLADPRAAVVDAGVVGVDGPGHQLVRGATRSLLVTRSCYLALRRAAEVPLTPTGIVLVHEPDRALDADDVEELLGAPVVALVGLDSAVSRAVDAGVLATRLPRRLARSLEAVA